MKKQQKNKKINKMTIQELNKFKTKLEEKNQKNSLVYKHVCQRLFNLGV